MFLLRVNRLLHVLKIFVRVDGEDVQTLWQCLAGEGLIKYTLRYHDLHSIFVSEDLILDTYYEPAVLEDRLRVLGELLIRNSVPVEDVIHGFHRQLVG